MDIILKNKRIICLAGCTLMAIAVFFTFAKVSVSMFGMSHTESTSFIEGDGWVVLICALAAGALIWFKKEKLSFIGTGIALITTVVDMCNVGDAAESVDGLAEVTLGLSPWLILIGVVLASAPIVISMLGSNKPANTDN